MSPAVIPVRLGEDSYAITVQSGLLADAGPLIRAVSRSSKAILIHDTGVPRESIAPLLASLRQADFTVTTIDFPSGEDHKSLNDVSRLYDEVLSAKIDRHTPILSLGGGVTGDLVGFVAATVLRGVPFIQIPTTLLAMVDASVGGKTGINHARGKNLIGAFHQPAAVLIDPAVLRTLPARELRGGLAECIKHDCIRDAGGFGDLEANIHRALDLDIDYLTSLVAHNVAIKARVVENDPFEKGERAHLNFGHTFGHAIEIVSKYGYSHGESVALGMTAATDLSVQLGLLDESSRRRIVVAIARAGLPTRGLTLDPDAVVEAMAFDKKTKSGRINFVLLDRIGHAVIRDDVPLEAVRRAIHGLMG